MLFDELAWERFKNRVRDGAYQDTGGVEALGPAAMRAIGLDTVSESGKVWHAARLAAGNRGSLFDMVNELERLVRIMPEPIRQPNPGVMQALLQDFLTKIPEVDALIVNGGINSTLAEARRQLLIMAEYVEKTLRPAADAPTPPYTGEPGSFIAQLCRLVEEQQREIVFSLETAHSEWDKNRMEKVSALGDKMVALIMREFGPATYESLSGRAAINAILGEPTKAEAAEPLPGTVEYAAHCPDPWRQNAPDDCAFQPAGEYSLAAFTKRAEHRAEQARAAIKAGDFSTAYSWAMALRDDARETLKGHERSMPAGPEFETVSEAVSRQLETIMAEADKHFSRGSAIVVPSPWRMVWHTARWAWDAIHGNYDPIIGPWPPQPKPQTGATVVENLIRIAREIDTAETVYSHGAYQDARNKMRELGAEVQRLADSLKDTSRA